MRCPPPPYLPLLVTLVTLVTALHTPLESLPFFTQAAVTTRATTLVTSVTAALPITLAARFPIDRQTTRGLSSITGIATQDVFPVVWRPDPSLSEEVATI